jgi:hypothetical protein
MLFLIFVLFYACFVLFCVFLCCMYCLFCVILCIACVYMSTKLLPPGGYPIALKYISYHISYWPKLRLALTSWIGPKHVACTVVQTVMKYSHTQSNAAARFQNNKVTLKTKISQLDILIIVFALRVLLYGRRCNIRRTLRRPLNRVWPLIGTVQVSHTPAVGRTPPATVADTTALQ